MNKVSLSPLDTKRYILDDGITTLAFGHYKIDEYEALKEMLLELQ